MSTEEKIVGILWFIEFWWEPAAVIAIYFSRRVISMR